MVTVNITGNSMPVTSVGTVLRSSRECNFRGVRDRGVMKQHSTVT